MPSFRYQPKWQTRDLNHLDDDNDENDKNANDDNYADDDDKIFDVNGDRLTFGSEEAVKADRGRVGRGMYKARWK